MTDDTGLFSSELDADLYEILEKKFKEIQDKLNSHEEMLAQVVTAYGEMFALITAVVEDNMAPKSEEERKAFEDNLKQQRKQLIEAFIGAEKETGGIPKSSENDQTDSDGQ